MPIQMSLQKTRIPRLFWGIALVLSLLAAPAWARLENVYNPDPIQVPAGKSMEQVRQAIRKALVDKGFNVRELGPGHIEGKYNRSGRGGLEHVAVFNVRFDNKIVRITYKSSKDLNYDPATKQIHSTYNKWIRTAEKHIRARLEGTG